MDKFEFVDSVGESLVVCVLVVCVWMLWAVLSSEDDGFLDVFDHVDDDGGGVQVGDITRRNHAFHFACWFVLHGFQVSLS